MLPQLFPLISYTNQGYPPDKSELIMPCERCGNATHFTEDHVKETARFSLYKDATHDFDPDSFVSNVHLLDNKTLFDNCIEMQKAFARVVTTSWPSVMRCAWMVGVYEREAKYRQQRWIVR